ncbi:ClcB-like voltage-gated chloride channel protein [Ramlibacter humi]|uniref:Voltage-gated chloride channel ClcB n=1 Tax=Ramlibacter humi TaxID=2530451 RepID=A0A4Z0BF94_9BURK|nr:ClcB-like voltage-gated chloride channel protein [Ramlibacter humi]TFY97049.1 voltage-gated chloride channel ClcB [Ramlibacter humi]
MRKRVESLFLLLERIRPTDWQRTLAWAAVAGATGALATLAFRQGLVLIEHLLYGPAAGLVQAAERLVWWQRLLSPALGGALAGVVLVIARRLPRRTPHGDYMEAVVLGRGELETRASLLRALSSACTVASGGAIGREGPMVQLAALTGSLVAGWRNMPVPRRRLLVACAAAAGLTTAYGTPIAGAMFIAEIVLQSLATETLAPLLIASVTAHATVAALVGTAALYRMPDLPALRAPELLLAGALGLLVGLLAPLYLWLLDLARRAFGAWRASLPLKMAAGGLLVGLLSLQSPQVWGNGFSVVNSVLQGEWAWQALLLVLLLKLAAVAATTGSGAVGGIFTPTLFVGAVSGALFALGAAALPFAHLPVPAGAAIGMGAFLAASTHAPLTSVLMVFEMTENYTVVAPLMLACVLAYAVSRLLRPDSVYASSQRQKAAADPRLAVAGDLLRTGTPAVQPGQSIEQVERALLESRWRHVYVVDTQARFLGAIAMHDLAAELKKPHDPASPWPADLLQGGYPRLSRDMPLWEVLAVFERHAGERLPVVDGEGRLLGHVAKTDLVLMLRERLAIS